MRNKKLKVLILLSIIMVFTFSIVACRTSDIDDTQDEVQENQITVEEITGDENAEDEIIVIIDHLGRNVEFEEPAETIVSGYYITTSMMIALDLQDNVVGLEARPETRPIYSLAAPGFLELPTVGSMKEFDLEGAAALEPD